MVILAVSAAVAGAASIGLATAAQQRAAVSISAGPQSLARLLRRPLWLLGLAATVVGLGLQLFALSIAPITLVQPVLV
ncbi:MAG: hypothetical protein H0V92_06810, partial [Pseudonocardiales bacterium]|nr:hypothetical protein [Pseudonocardiales bacterium]